jgi:hypothetical protein
MVVYNFYSPNSTVEHVECSNLTREAKGQAGGNRDLTRESLHKQVHMDDNLRLGRILALFDRSTSLTLPPYKTVTIRKKKYQLDTKRLLWNAIKFSPAPKHLIDKVQAAFKGRQYFACYKILVILDSSASPLVDIASREDQSPDQWAAFALASGARVASGELEQLAERLFSTLLLPRRPLSLAFLRSALRSYLVKVRQIGSRSPSDSTEDYGSDATGSVGDGLDADSHARADSVEEGSESGCASNHSVMEAVNEEMGVDALLSQAVTHKNIPALKILVCDFICIFCAQMQN